jgi:hypothetical protein
MKDQVYCVFCAKTHKLDELKSRLFFTTGKAYFCGEEEIARSKDDRLVYWNGREFETVK